MKKIFLVLVACFILVGCTAMAPFKMSSVNQGEERLASIGDIFLDHKEGQSYKDPFLGEVMSDDSMRYELTILELNNEKLGLQYNEFFYSKGSGSPFSPATFVPAGWMVKQGYNKRFDYSLSDKIVRFKGTEFEILSVENGQIKYKRVK